MIFGQNRTKTIQSVFVSFSVHPYRVYGNVRRRTRTADKALGAIEGAARADWYTERVTDISLATRERVRAAWPTVLLELAAGDLVRDVLGRAGIADSVKRAYLDTEPGARKQWDEAREASADAFYDEALAIARKLPASSAGNGAQSGDTRERPALDSNERRLLVDTLKWAARIRNPRLYSDKQTLDVNVRTVDLTRIIQDANARLAQARAPALIEGKTGEIVPEVPVGAILESMLR